MSIRKKNKENIHIFDDFPDKKGVDTRLQSAQNALLLQEDTIRRGERERKTMLDQITALERQLLALDGDKKQLIVRIYFFFSDKNETFSIVYLSLRRKMVLLNQVNLVYPMRNVT